MSLLFALLISTANAGWWSDWCARQIVAPSPYQFEQVGTAAALREFDRLSIKATWGAASEEDLNILRILRVDLEFRVQYGKPEEADLIIAALTRSMK